MGGERWLAEETMCVSYLGKSNTEFVQSSDSLLDSKKLWHKIVVDLKSWIIILTILIWAIKTERFLSEGLR